MYAIDLAKGVTETIDSETWSGIDSHEAVERMVATVDPEDLGKLVGAVSLRTLAGLSNPLHISDGLREKLARLCPDMLADIDRWAEEDSFR